MAVRYDMIDRETLEKMLVGSTGQERGHILDGLMRQENRNARFRPQWPLWNSFFFALFVVLLLWATVAAYRHAWYDGASLAFTIAFFTSVFAFPYLQDAIRPVVALVPWNRLASFKLWVCILWAATLCAWLYNSQQNSDGRFVHANGTLFDKRTGSLYTLEGNGWVLRASPPAQGN